MKGQARDEEGFALVAAIILLTVMIGLGLGLLLFTDSQTKDSAKEQAKESAFNVAEAALNAQVGQISRAWPLAETTPKAGCTALSSTSSNACPDKASLEKGYPNISPVSCPEGTPKDAWGSPLTNQWTTYVRAPESATSTAFNSANEQGNVPYDEGGKFNRLWVRAVGVVQCQVVSLVTLVTRQVIALNFPQNAVTANWFETTNNGNKVIVDTQGKESQPAGVSMRCTGFTGTATEIEEKCKNYRKGQVNPDTTKETAPSPSVTMTASQLESKKQEAEAAGTYYAAGKCPSGLPVGTIVYVEGPCAVSGGSNEVANTEAKPGFLVIANGTFSMGGTSTFYGVVYLPNKQESSNALVSLSGNAHLIGALTIDGNGGVEFGSSKENLEYNSKAIKELKTYVGATPTRNTFRELPITQ